MFLGEWLEMFLIAETDRTEPTFCCWLPHSELTRTSVHQRHSPLARSSGVCIATGSTFVRSDIMVESLLNVLLVRVISS